MRFPKSLKNKLNRRNNENALRQLGRYEELVDFSSNDYLGFAKSEVIFNAAHHYLLKNNITHNGATGSRLLSGNHYLHDEVEDMLCKFHKCESALVFNSGYDANIGFFSSVPQRGDIILYDELIHASIRDGIAMSYAKAYKFKHNNLEDLNAILKRVQHDNATMYVVTESVFSMDGDSPDLLSISKLCKDYDAYVIVDEAHAIGVFGKGLVKEPVFARIVTFGKALGSHGAAILGSTSLKTYLVNFARSFIYTTALPPHSLATIICAYNILRNEKQHVQQLTQNRAHFKSELKRLNISPYFIKSNSAIQSCIITGNDTVKQIAKNLKENGFDVKPILSPTVAKDQERLRFCLHSYNSSEEITKVLELLATFVL